MSEENKDKDKEGKPGKGNPNDEEEIKTKGQHTKKIKVSVDRDPEIDALQKELAELKVQRDKEKEEADEKIQKLEGEKGEITDELTEKKAILQKAALEAFEKEKKSILDLCKQSKLSDEQLEEIEGKLTDPSQLATVKTLVGILVSKTDEGEGDEDKKKTGEGKKGEKKPPAGKPVFTPPKDAKEYKDVRTMVDQLYKTAYNDPEATVEQRKDAEKQIAKLWDAFLGGKSWKSLKAGARYPLGQITECPRCHHIFMGDDVPDKCTECGYSLKSLQKGD